MRIAVLGPLEVLTDDAVPVAVTGPAERLLLAALVAGAPGAVSTADLLRILGDVSSDELRGSLGRLRTALEPGLPDRSSGQYVLRRGAGYAVVVPRSDVDVLHAADLVGHGRARLAEGDAAEAVRLLTAALALWRGRPYADWPDAPFADKERQRLDLLSADAEAALGEARSRVPAVPQHPVARPAGTSRTFVALARPPDDVPPSVSAEPVAPAPVDPDPEPPRPEPVTRRRTGRRVGVAVLLLGALLVGGLTVRSQRAADRAAAADEARVALEIEASALAGAARAAGTLDTSLLLSVQAVRLAETPETRSQLLAAVAALGRVQRVLSVPGTPEEPILVAGGRTLAFRSGTAIFAWPGGLDTAPRVLVDVPSQWRLWLTAAPSPTRNELMIAGVEDGVPWLRMITTDGWSKLLLEGEEIGGWPLDGAISADGRRILLVVAEPARDTDKASRWELLDVSVADGTTRDTGVAGTFPASVDQLRVDVADDAGSVVLWAADMRVPAVLVDLADRRTVSLSTPPLSVPTVAFRALPMGAAQLWEDGLVTLIDARGEIVQHLHAHGAPVRDVVVAPDATWAATFGDDGVVRRWPIEPGIGRWAAPETLSGHSAGVVGGAVDAEGETLFTVGRDNTVITWDMTLDGVNMARVRRGSADPAAWMEDVCAVVGRDLSPGEWTRYLSDRPWRPTCSDLP